MGLKVLPPRTRRAREGAAAVEFGIVALPFFMMIFAILELGMVFVLDSVLESAVVDTGRLVRTGQAEAEGFNAAVFKSQLCGRMRIFSADCANRLTVDVREIPRFRTPTLPDPMESGAFEDSSLAYANGQPGSLMVVRAWYRHTLFTPFLSQGLSRLNDGAAMLTATSAFRNEPWQPAGPTPAPAP